MSHPSNSPSNPDDDPVSRLESACATDWRHIADARARSTERRAKIAMELESSSLIPTDTCFVVFGSVARQEVTSEKSDLDWALLVDGQAQESHLSSAQMVRAMLQELSYPDPGGTGLFGGPAFSHELIHCIGGEADSNKITTRRVLLVLESEAIGPHAEVRTRVVRQLLKRYIEDDDGYRPHDGRQAYVPRFLLNDIVRFWRTMAVDFAAKRRERAGEGWALRRLKLRLSRKLLFVSGLAACMTCKLRPNAALSVEHETGSELCGAMTEQLLEFVDRTPLEVLAQAFLDYGATAAGQKCFEAYDEFLGVLADDGKRSSLEELPPGVDSKNELLIECDRIADQFQSGISELFFKTNDLLTSDTQRYGVF